MIYILASCRALLIGGSVGSNLLDADFLYKVFAAIITLRAPNWKCSFLKKMTSELTTNGNLHKLKSCHLVHTDEANSAPA